MNRTIFFITHPEVNILPTIPITDWSLSEIGKHRLKSIFRMPWINTIGSLYCSSERKSIDSAEIISDFLNLRYVIVKELGEVDRSRTGYLPPEKHTQVVELFYSKPYESILFRERAIDAQSRITKAVRDIIDRNHEDMNIAIISHGAVAALLIAYITNTPISKDLGQPGLNGGYYFTFNEDMNVIYTGWKKIDD